MAVVYAACVDCCHVAFPSNWRTVQEWEERKYLSTLKSPGIEVLSTEAAFEIPA